jgi:hypothetical protein
MANSGKDTNGCQVRSMSRLSGLSVELKFIAFISLVLHHDDRDLFLGWQARRFRTDSTGWAEHAECEKGRGRTDGHER